MDQGIAQGALREAMKDPEKPSRGVDLDVIAVASVAADPSGLNQP